MSAEFDFKDLASEAAAQCSGVLGTRSRMTPVRLKLMNVTHDSMTKARTDMTHAAIPS